MVNKKRIAWIDIFRGFSIILVVVGHLEIPKALYAFIFSFHMYAFYFISGVTYKCKKSQTALEVWKTYFVKLYIPYIVYALLWFFFSNGMHYMMGEEIDFSFLNILLKLLSIICVNGIFTEGTSIGPAWFLMSLLIVSVGYDALRRIFWKCENGKKYVLVCCWVLFSIGYMLNGKSFLPFKIIPSLTAILFFGVGDVFKENIKKVSFSRIQYILGGTIAAIMLGGITYKTNIYVILVDNLLPPIHILLLENILGIIMLLFLSKFISTYKVITGILGFYGQNSMIIMGIHSPMHFVLRFILEEMGLEKAQTVIPVFVMTSILVIPISVIINKFIPTLNGKKQHR